MGDPGLLESLRNSRLAPELTEAQLGTLSDLAFALDMKAGEVLVNEGASDNHLYVLVSGALAVIRGVGTAEPVNLFALAPGDFVGELSFLDGTPHYASIVALGPVRVIGLEREKLESLLHQHPEIVYRVMRSIVRTVHQIQRRLSMQSAELTNYIYKQHGRY
jgi:CRP-like cAMP-binding protein